MVGGFSSNYNKFENFNSLKIVILWYNIKNQIKSQGDIWNANIVIKNSFSKVNF